MRTGCIASSGLGLAAALACAVAPASAITAPGYTVTEIDLPDYAAGDVVVDGGALFVGVGPGFSGAAQSVVRIDGGVTTTLADGFNALAGFAWDAANDRLLVTDNGLEAPGSETGDTLYAIPAPHGAFAEPLRAADLALLPAGSVPGIADVALDPGDPSGRHVFATDASASFPPAGRVLAIDLAQPSLEPVQTGLGYAAGLAADASTLYFGDVDAASFEGSVRAVALPGATGTPTPVAGGLGGQYDLELASDGALLATAGADLLRIDPATGDTATLASGFGFATGLFTDASGAIWVLDGGFPGVAKVYELTVPEPATSLPAFAALAAVAALRRRAPR